MRLVVVRLGLPALLSFLSGRSQAARTRTIVRTSCRQYGGRIVEAVTLRDSTPGLCCASSGFVSTGSIRFPPAANVLVVDAEDAFSRQSASETNRPFKQLNRGFSIRGKACWRCAAPRRVCVVCCSKLSDAVSTGRPITASVKEAAHPRICRRAFRSHHCGRTRPPTERESEALHRHGDEERELK